MTAEEEKAAEARRKPAEEQAVRDQAKTLDRLRRKGIIVNRQAIQRALRAGSTRAVRAALRKAGRRLVVY
jgi:hypothetical protein